MGNCLNTASKRRGQHGELLPEEEESLSEMRRISQLLREEEEEDDYDDGRPAEQAEDAEAVAVAVAAAPPAAVKVKIVLTRGELEWLMAQLKSGDHQRLHDVLQHVQAQAALDNAAADSSKPAAGWRPHLESIVECPDPEMATTLGIS